MLREQLAMSSTRSSKFLSSLTSLKSDFTEGCQRIKSWASDKIETKKPVLAPIESTPLLANTQSSSSTLAEFQKDVSKQCEKAKTWFSEKLTSETATAAKYKITQASDVMKSGLVELKTDVVKQCTKAKNWVSEKMESESSLRAKAVTQGAIKAAVGVYPLLDLLLSIIPATAPCYLGFKIAKFILTAIAFVIAAYSVYQSEKTDKNFNNTDKSFITILKEKLKEVKDLGFKMEEFELKEEWMLYEKGFGPIPKPLPEDYEQIKKANENTMRDLGLIPESLPEATSASTEEKEIDASFPDESKSTLTLLAESKPGVYGRAVVNGALSAAT